MHEVAKMPGVGMSVPQFRHGPVEADPNSLSSLVVQAIEDGGGSRRRSTCRRRRGRDGGRIPCLAGAPCERPDRRRTVLRVPRRGAVTDRVRRTPRVPAEDPGPASPMRRFFCSQTRVRRDRRNSWRPGVPRPRGTCSASQSRSASTSSSVQRMKPPRALAVAQFRAFECPYGFSSAPGASSYSGSVSPYIPTKKRQRIQSFIEAQSLQVNRPHLWLFCTSAAFGFRSGAPRGSGNCWFRCSHRLGSLSDAPAGDGALTRGCRNGGHLLRGGDWARITYLITCACPSSSLPTMKRRRLSAF